MNTLLRGLYSGFAAGTLVALLFFVDYGPGNGLHGVARWFALDNHDTGKWIGFLLLIVLGGLFGLLFGVLQGQRKLTISRAILTGLALGVALWFIFAFVVATFIGHIPLASFNLSSFLYPFVLSLFLGFLIGTVYYQSTLYSSLAT
ncbi:MAG TPA: hypothetical protein DDW33_05505 [Ktedonobacter sp.]|jgi:hypothetical protein|nr:hypothetical protein [Ktedonobacter sp.]HAH00497.1 hypothetical protein [Ktedonobacter sp.]HBE25129.1 hypothetical protein [Ktedonobacter sp.]HBE27849.1 hypothetical protein [Ktedonobacter sp.]HCF88174.1 hypothetical protein [Ktedonobacter sp.]